MHLAADWFSRQLPADLALPEGASRAQTRQALAEYVKPRLVQELSIPLLRRRA